MFAGRVVDWSIDGLKTASGASGEPYEVNLDLFPDSNENLPVETDQEVALLMRSFSEHLF